MPADFFALTTVQSLAPLRFEAVIPDGWQQGRGAFGGLVIANLVRALEASEPEAGRVLRSLTVEICGPVLPGVAAIDVEALRRGSGVSTLAARLTQGGEVLAHSVGVFGRARADRPRRTFFEGPVLPPWREIPVVQPSSVIPPFGRFFETRCTGPRVFSGAREPIAEGWIRLLHPGPVRDAAYVAACSDAWWPGILSMELAPRPMGTLSFTLELVGTCDGLPPEAPFFHRGRVVAENEGYVVEFRELWGEDGRLIALNQQTIAVIR